MIGVLLLLMVEGIALALTASDGRSVTLRWLRLGGLIALSLLAVAGTVDVMSGRGERRVLVGLGAAGALVIAQLMAAQLGRRGLQRVLAAAGALAAGAAAAGSLVHTLQVAGERAGLAAGSSTVVWMQAGSVALLSGGIMGGFLMTMLLGHAYLTAGNEMTQRPFARLVVLLGVLLALRLALSGATALWPWWRADASGRMSGGFDHMWTVMMLIARYLVGLVVPGVFTWMTYDCVKRRANQSATGILYVAGVLVIIGEGVALALMGTTGRGF